MVLVSLKSSAEILLPSPNRSLLKEGSMEDYFVGTVGRTWESGRFGCVRSEGWQIHEGIDIQPLTRDAGREPTDPVFAVYNGKVAYLNSKPGLSTFGRYVVLFHRIDGLEVYTLYAHLREIDIRLKPNLWVHAGDQIGILGRSSNTASGISKERAHLHFEIGLFANDHFEGWYRKFYGNSKNHHGLWNGMNLLGFNPEELFLDQARLGQSFSLLAWVRTRKELFRVRVTLQDFPFLRRYRNLIVKNPDAERSGIGGYELAFTFNGIPFQIQPIPSGNFQKDLELVSVNETEYRDNPCRKYITRRGDQWLLTNAGERFLHLILWD